jgi:hypothetical protein
MAYAVCLQDWTTITGASAQVITQNEEDWLDLSGFQDVTFYLEVANSTATLSNNVLVDVQTSPTKDDVFFLATLTLGAPYLVRFALGTSASPFKATL